MNYTRYVNVKMGTDSVPEFSNGNTLPITAFPFGMNHFSPETRNANLFFNPSDVRMLGIRLTHQVSPWLSDYNSFTVCSSVNGSDKYDASVTVSSYDRDRAILTPSYIKMHLNLFNSDLEFSPTLHGGIYKTSWAFEGYENILKFKAANGKINYSFSPKKDKLYITVKSERSWIKISDDFKLYGVFVFDKKALNVTEKNGCLLVSFGKRVKNLVARFATSFISHEQAEYNYELELQGKTLTDIRRAADNEWEKYLSKIEIDAPKKQMQTFYSCFYRCFLFPRVLHEKCPDGVIRHADPSNGKVNYGPFYTDNCFWDTFRTLFPLYSLIDSALFKEMCEGFMNFYRGSGWLPRCAAPSAANCMPGTAIDAVFADAVTKGVVTDKSSIEEMLSALMNHVENVPPDPAVGRNGVEDFNSIGYVSNAYNESVNKTLDYSYGNFCISRLAHALDKHELAKKLEASSKNYRNLFDKETGFFRAKDKNGNKRSDFTEFDWGGDYTEGSVWQNNFSVYHDRLGHSELLGGRKEFSELLNRLFLTPPIYKNYAYPCEIHEMTEMAASPQFGQCALSNQPSLQHRQEHGLLNQQYLLYIVQDQYHH